MSTNDPTVSPGNPARSPTLPQEAASHALVPVAPPANAVVGAGGGEPGTGDKPGGGETGAEQATSSAPTGGLDLKGWIGSAFQDLWSLISAPPRGPAVDAAIVERAAQAAPVVWLIGKVQSGKSSVVGALTGSSAAEVGSGFKACTATARLFEFPSEAPVIRFLDTRGFGEAGYDPAADIAVAEQQAHLLLVVMKAMDPAQHALIDVVQAVRARHPDWPVVVVHSCLHEAYPAGSDHPGRYPFGADATPLQGADGLPPDLARAIVWQQKLFSKLRGRGPVAFAAIDFTQPGDGFTPELFGLEALLEALTRVAPAAITTVLDTQHSGQRNAALARARPHILGYAAAAAAVDVLPVAGVIAVPGIQAKMMHSLGEIYGMTWDRRMVGEFAGALGAGVLMRAASSFGARQLAKLVPAYGQTAGAAAAAAMSFATTYALGEAAAYYLGARQAGAIDTAGVHAAYQAALREAFGMAKGRTFGASAKLPDGTDGKSGGGVTR